MRLRLLLRRNECRVCQPGFDSAKVICLQSVQVRATNAKEALPLVQDRWQLIAVGEENPAADLRAVGQAHERGQLTPSQSRPVRAKLHLVCVEVSEQRLEHAINAIIFARESNVWRTVVGTESDGQILAASCFRWVAKYASAKTSNARRATVHPATLRCVLPIPQRSSRQQTDFA